MRILFLLLALASFRSFAYTSAHCELTSGIYKNSAVPLNNLRFETLVDIFTLNNARSLSLNLAGDDYKFLRSDIAVTRQTRMMYQLKRKDKILRTIHVMIDRTPKEVTEAREFYGNMIIFPDGDEIDFLKVSSRPKTLVYNFFCEF